MIGLVLVSHSEPLAVAVRELALQMAGGDPPPIAVAAGAGGGLGTDATAIATAIDDLAPGVDGVLVIPDLGSAVLSAELALDLRESAVPVVVGDGPFVEGAVVAVVSAAGGADLDAVTRDAAGALRVKRPEGDAAARIPAADDTAPAASGAAPTASADVVLPNRLGLHARPAAILARAAAELDAPVTVTDLTTGRGPADAASVLAVLALGAVGGDTVRVQASGPGAGPAVHAVVALLADGFGEAP